VDPRNHVLDGSPDPPCEVAIWVRGQKHYLLGRWLAERARSTIFLQRNPSFGETSDQVHFSCRKLCWKMTKYDEHILWLTVSVYELFECRSYTQSTQIIANVKAQQNNYSLPNNDKRVSELFLPYPHVYWYLHKQQRKTQWHWFL